ncbi:MAG: ABC transporter permease [Acutalibacter sp.]
MKAIFKREVRSYFSSPVGYVFVAALTALYGFYYYQAMLTSSSSYISYVYYYMFTFSMMIIPIITMRSMTDDQKNKTDQALLTAPVGVTSIVLGKFFACCFVYFIATTLGGILPALVMSTFSTPSWGEIIGNYIGALLYGAAMISIGVFISSLTVSQIIAAIGTFVISVVLMYLDSLANAVSNQFISTVIQWLSFNDRYSTFTQGMFSISSVFFFVSVAAVFIFLTARKVESRRWS